MLATALALAAAVVSDVAVHREGMNGKPDPTLHFISFDDGSVEVDNRDSCGRSVDGIWVPSGKRVTVAPSVAAAASLRDERLAASAADVRAKGFRYELEIDFSGAGKDELLVAVPGALQLYFRSVDRANAKFLQAWDTRLQNYGNFPLPDGTCPVLEAWVPGPAGRIGIPLGFLTRPTGVKKVVLNHTTVHWQIYVEDALDENLPFSELAWPASGAVAQICSPRVKAARFAVQAETDIGRTRYGKDGMRKLAKSVQYFTPPDHNAWTGDVATGFDRGRFHIFYLFDRRHHASKAGRGAHYFAHLSSTDLVNWYEHPAAAALDARWESHGTGTPFAWNGKYYLAYGLHTVRTIAWEKTTGPTMSAYRAKHGREGQFKMSDLAPLVPQGGTYAVSEDGGISFRKSGILFTSAQNPTVYNRWDGLLGLADYTKLNWSDRFGDWKVWDEKILSHGDCPSAFEWNGHHYIIQGFFTMSYSPNGEPGSYVSWETTGDDVYDGLAVPMVSPFVGNRRIMAGWINHLGGWGGWLCFRELVQYPDGKLGSKWLKETPPPTPPQVWKGLSPSETFAVRFASQAEKERRLEFRVEPLLGRAQFADVGRDGVAPRQRTLRELVLSLPPEDRVIQKVNRLRPPNSAESFAIGKIRGLGRAYDVRLVAWYDAKSDATVFDAEIAGQRTMVCRRPGKWRLEN